MVLLWVKPARSSQNVPQPQLCLQQNAHFWWLDTCGKPAVCLGVHKHASERLKPTDAITQWLRAKRRRLLADKWTKLVSYTRFRTFHTEWDAPLAFCTHYRLNTSPSSANKSRSRQLPRLSSKSAARLWQHLSCLSNTEVNAHYNSGREACPHGHTNTGKQAECNKSGGGEAGCLLSEFFVQLIFVCEAGGGHDCSHDEWSRGRGDRASRFSGRLAQVSAELVKVQKREARAKVGAVL